MKLVSRLLVPAACAALFSWLAWRSVRGELDETVRTLAGVAPGWIALNVVATVVAQTARTLRWRALLGAVSETAPPWRRLVPVSLVGYLAMFTLPALGELVRPLLIRDGGEVRGGAALATVAVERVLDGLAVALLAAAAIAPMLGRPDTPAWARWVCFGGLGFFFGVGALLALLHRLRERLIDGAGRALGRVSAALAARATSVLRSFLEALDVVARRGVARPAVGYTLGYWACNGVAVWLIVRACGISLTVQGVWALIGVMVVSFLVPTVGQIGTYHYFFVKGMALSRVPAAPALGCALLAHAVQVALFLAGGLPSLFAPEVARARRARREAAAGGA